MCVAHVCAIDSTCPTYRYNESGQYEKDIKAANKAAASNNHGTGHYLEAGNGVQKKKEKWVPPNGMSFKEYKEYKKRLKLKRSGFFD